MHGFIPPLSIKGPSDISKELLYFIERLMYNRQQNIDLYLSKIGILVEFASYIAHLLILPPCGIMRLHS